MTRRWVVNASPLIAAWDLGLGESQGEHVNFVGWVEVRNPTKAWVVGFHLRSTQPTLRANCKVDMLPSQVLSWIYQNPGYEAILDDRAAKNAAAALGIPVRGTLGVILLAKREGRVESARVLFEQLVQVGLRVSPEVLATALQLVGE